MHIRAAMRQAAPRVRSVPLHSHTLQFAGSKKTYRHGTVDFFDKTCPICEAITAGREPVCEFVQPIPGAHQANLSLTERFTRWRVYTLTELFGRWPLRGPWTG